jgi:hypothetical protein
LTKFVLYDFWWTKCYFYILYNLCKEQKVIIWGDNNFNLYPIPSPNLSSTINSFKIKHNLLKLSNLLFFYEIKHILWLYLRHQIRDWSYMLNFKPKKQRISVLKSNYAKNKKLFTGDKNFNLYPICSDPTSSPHLREIVRFGVDPSQFCPL